MTLDKFAQRTEQSEPDHQAGYKAACTKPAPTYSSRPQMPARCNASATPTRNATNFLYNNDNCEQGDHKAMWSLCLSSHSRLTAARAK